LRVLICGHSRVTGRISKILNRLGAEVLTSTELPSGDNPQTMGPELILLHLGDEQLQTLRQSAASTPVYLLLNGYDQDWFSLGRTGACGYISIHASDEVLAAYLKTILKQATCACDHDIQQGNPRISMQHKGGQV